MDVKDRILNIFIKYQIIRIIVFIREFYRFKLNFLFNFSNGLTNEEIFLQTDTTRAYTQKSIDN